MVSEYDFKSIERNLSSLEKELSDFERNFDNTLKPILNASFDKTKYGERALEQRLNEISNNAKKDVNNLYNSFINDIRRYCHSSMQKIKAGAKDTCSYIDELNTTLDSVNRLNYSFSQKDYQATILLANALRQNSSVTAVTNYVLLVELEAYEKICSAMQSDISKEDFDVCEQYYTLCESYNCKAHILSARTYLFESAFKLVEQSSDTHSDDEVYHVCVAGLRAYNGFDVQQKNKFALQKEKLHELGIKIFNIKSINAYCSFDYQAVKTFLSDSIYFNSKDIENKFFADAVLTPKRVFAYLKEYTGKADLNNIDLAFSDSKALATSPDRESYFEYWFACFDSFGWKYCKEIINAQENRYVANALITESIIKNCSYIKKIGELSSCLFENYHTFLVQQELIDLDQFLVSSIEINKMLRTLAKSSEYREKGSLLQTAISGFDGLSYGMITKYLKICLRYNDSIIKELSIVLDDASNRLYGKSYKKDLKHDASKQSVERTGEKVRLVTAQGQQNKKKRILLLGAIGIVIIIAIVVIIIFKAK